MLEHLFGSKTRLKLLRTFFREPSRAYYIRELTRELDTQINAIRREIEVLSLAGLLKEIDQPGGDDKTKVGSSLRKYYILDAESILYPEMQALLLKGQTLGEEEFVKQLKKKGGKIKMLVLTGRFTSDSSVETDILLAGEIKPRVIEKLIKDFEKDFGFEIRYTILTEEEFLERRHMMDKFLYGIFEAKHVSVIDEFKV